MLQSTLVMLGGSSELQLPGNHVITELITGTLRCAILPMFFGYCVLWFCIPSCLPNAPLCARVLSAVYISGEGLCSHFVFHFQ